MMSENSSERPADGVPEVAPRGRRHGRAAVRLSRVDRERLERGEISTPEEALHLNDAGQATSAAHEVKPAVEAKDANERRLLGERPPHFGKL